MSDERAFLDAVEMGLRGEDRAPESDTSEPDHTHICPACGDSWVHADVDCKVVYPGRTWALCPIHRGGDDA